MEFRSVCLFNSFRLRAESKREIPAGKSKTTLKGRAIVGPAWAKPHSSKFSNWTAGRRNRSTAYTTPENTTLTHQGHWLNRSNKLSSPLAICYSVFVSPLIIGLFGNPTNLILFGFEKGTGYFSIEALTVAVVEGPRAENFHADSRAVMPTT